MKQLEALRNLLGPLSHDCRNRIKRLISNPTPKNWNAARSIIVCADGWTTLWQVVAHIDPNFPTRGESAVAPDQITLMRALKHAETIHRAPWQD